MSNPVIVLIPGSWHRPQHYRRVIYGLTNSNYTTIGISLLSVDCDPPHTTWEPDAAAVRETIIKVLDSGRNVIMLAHSSASTSMSKAVKGLRKTGRADSASVGHPQTAGEEAFQKRLMEHVGSAPMQVEKGLLVPDRVIVRDTFYNRCEPADIEEARDLLGSSPAAPLSVLVTWTAYKSIPSTYIVCENDHALAQATQARMIAQGNGAFIVERCQEGHSPFISNPGFIVDCVRRAAGEKV